MLLQGVERRFPIGAELVNGGAHFRVWAPARRRVEVIFESPRTDSFLLEKEEGGYFSGSAEVPAGALYRFRLDDDAELYADPASRFQPSGPEGPSQVVDAKSHRWRVPHWPGVGRTGHVIYEVHVGTFTEQGTWSAAIEKLPRLAQLGVTLIELMPVHDFPGRFGWGYDGVNLWAPTRLYGTPDEFRSFVDAAHAAGLGVILDVVYNHLGPDGNCLKRFTPDYFSEKHTTDWGEAINFDGRNAAGAREFFIENAGYWIDEFRLDGLRLDATQNIYDASSGEHIIAAVARRAREAAGKRSIYIVAENEPQDVRLIRSRREGGFELDAMWNDDFHHSAIVALTGRNEAYYTDYLGRAQEFVSMAKYGFLYQGQMYKWQKNRRGTPALEITPSTFINYIQNHDQVANTGFGKRIHHLTAPGRIRAMTALLLLGPGTPMMFQGQEFGASSPFMYFADHKPELAEKVAKGRGEFLSQFPSLKTDAAQKKLPRPDEQATFVASKLNWAEWDTNAEVIALHRDLLELRKTDFMDSRVDGAVLNDESFLLRFMREGSDDRLLLVNLGRDLHFHPAPEPLLAPPHRHHWELLWSSESPEYGGSGTPPVEREDNWHIPAHAAVLMKPVRNK